MKYLFLSGTIFILSFLGFLKPANELGSFLLSKFAVPFRHVAGQTQDAVTFFAGIAFIYKENQDLKAQLLNLQPALVALSELAEENSVLKSRFSDGASNTSSTDLPFPPPATPNKTLVLANVTGNSQDPTHSTVFLDVGENKGVQEGDMVIYKTFLLGVVREVYKYRSLAHLVFSPELKVAVKIIPGGKPTALGDVLNDLKPKQDILSAPSPATVADIAEPVSDLAQFQTEGLVSGDFGMSVKLERVLQKEPLSPGDILVTSGRDGLFRRGYIVGKVGDVYAEPTEPLKSAQVLPFVDISRLDKVFVLRQGSENISSHAPSNTFGGKFFITFHSETGKGVSE